MYRPEPPVVDPRAVEDLASRLRSRAREAVPEWHPAAGGDVGTALEQVASRFAAQLIDRINRVPTHAMRGFLESAGVAPLPAQPARVTLAFALRTGAGRTVVPAGVQVEAPATPDRPAAVFETLHDLTVHHAEVAAVEVLDPVWDRVTDVLDAETQDQHGAQGVGVPAFAGLFPARHDLLLTSPGFAALEERSTVALTVTVDAAADRSATTALLRSLVLTGVRADSPVTCAGVQRAIDDRSGAGPATLTVTATCGPVEAFTLALPGPLPDHACAEVDVLRQVAVLISTASRPPRAVVVDGAPRDTSTAFLPFGPVPSPGSELAVSDPLLAHSGATITLALTLDPGTPEDLSLAWDWHDGTSWQPLSGVTDTTNRLSRDGAFSFTSPGCPNAKVAGVDGHWVRVRVTTGGYGQPARYVPKNANDLSAGMVLEAGTGDLDAPRVLTVNLTAVLNAPELECVRRSHTRIDPALGRPLAAGLDHIPGPEATADQALLVGIDGELGNAPVSMHVATTGAPTPPRGRPIGNTGPAALAWEYLSATGWRPLTVSDSTGTLSRSGVVSFVAPDDLADIALAGRPRLRWIRARATTEVPPDGPRIGTLTVNAVDALAGETVAWEPLGATDGRAHGQTRLARIPVLPGQELFARELEAPHGDELRALVEAEGPSVVAERVDPATGRSESWVRWQEVATFTASGPRDRHYTLDRATGTVRFGGDGRGLAVPRGTALAARYRCGGGAAGNVDVGEVTRLRTSVADVTSVRNLVAADGGSDAERVDLFERRGPAALRHRGRAITSADVLWHTRELAGTRVARCLVPAGTPRGDLTVVVVPHASGPAPTPTSTLLALLEEELRHRLPVDLTVRGGVRVLPPSYRQVSVVAELEAERPEQAEQVKARALTALGEFLHALTGGPARTGWPLGRAVFESEVAERLGDVDGVRAVRSVRLVPNALTQRIGFRSPLLVPLGLTIGSRAASFDGGTVWTLDEPVPAGSAVDSVTVRGVTDGDLLHVMVDGTATGATSSGTGPAVVHLATARGAEVATTFPPGSVLVDQTGTRIGWLRESETTGRDVLRLRLGPVAQPVREGQPVTLVHASSVVAAQVHATGPSGGQGGVVLRGNDTSAVVSGTTLGVVGHPMRAPVVSATPHASGQVLVSTRSWLPGDRADLLADDSRLAEVASVRDVDDVVHLDGGALVTSGTHVIRLVGG